jgi:hypothetical protein
MTQRIDAVTLAKYYLWLSSTDYYQEPRPCDGQEAKAAALRIIKREVEKSCKIKK